VDLFAIDDSAARACSRDGMGPLVVVGGIHVPGESVRDLEVGLDKLCADAGFPPGDEFKWSPPDGAWMRDGLVDEARTEFFLSALGLAADTGVKAIVVMEDTNRAQASSECDTPEEDVTMMFLERAQASLGGRHGIVVFDRPGGKQKDEDEFLAKSIERIRSGTAYTKLDKLTLALATDSKLSRSIQLADVVTSCSRAFVSGETTFSPPVFNEGILPILREEYGCKGGRGLKIQPDYRYGNLYHWLLGDTHHVKFQEGHPLPSNKFTSYRESPDIA
jgi:hypothetical protein